MAYTITQTKLLSQPYAVYLDKLTGAGAYRGGRRNTINGISSRRERTASIYENLRRVVYLQLHWFVQTIILLVCYTVLDVFN